MRRCLVLLLALLALGPATGARAQEMSANVERVATIPGLPTAISLNFIGDTMFVSTATGIYSYDVSDPTAPALLGALPMYIWENEDVDVDVERERLFVSRDPRGFTTPASGGDMFPFGAVHVIDVSDPATMTQVGFFTVPAGHTTTCVNDCDFVWTGGPYANGATQPDFVGRPIYATDVTDPANPQPCPEPIDTGRNDGVTDYAHDVQVDEQGVAWVSGAGGIRGYWTSGEHRDPLTGEVRTATGCDPVPYGGSGTPEEATPSRFMHNAWRETYETARTVRRKCTGKRRRAARKRCRRRPPRTVVERREVLFGTEENIVSDCAASGRFATYELAGTLDGEGFRDTATTRHRMRALDTFTPEGAEGSSGCASAHYFDSRGDGVFANSFYEQGVRFLDLSDPADIRQIGWYRPADANVWAPYWHKGYVFVADFTRGVDVLRFSGSAASPTRRAPALTPKRRASFDPAWLGGLCPLPDRG